jgi:hypothetical protein
VIKMGVAVRNLLHEFGFDHDFGLPLLGVKAEGAKARASRQASRFRPAA